MKKFVDLTICSSDHHQECNAEIASLQTINLYVIAAADNGDQIAAEEVHLACKSDDPGSSGTALRPVASASDDQDEKLPEKTLPGQSVRSDGDGEATGDVTPALCTFHKYLPHAEEWFNRSATRCLWQKNDGERCGSRIAVIPLSYEVAL